MVANTGIAAIKVMMDHVILLSDAELISQSVLEKGHLAHAAIVLRKSLGLPT